MEIIAPNFETIPSALTDLEQFVYWRDTPRDGKSTKMPLNISRTPASSTNPDTWMAYETAVIHYNEQKDSGIGFVFTADDDLLGIDLDGCRDPETGELADWAKNILEAFQTYTEVSPSGTGVKLFCRSSIQPPKGKKKELPFDPITPKNPGIEVYSRGRYFALTGHVVNGYTDIQDRSQQVGQLMEHYWPYNAEAKEAQQQDWRSDDAVVERARKYVAKIPAAVSGERGHDKTYHVACVLAKDFGLDHSQVMDVLHEYNQRCDPPWTEAELERKGREGAKAKGPVGRLRDAAPDRYDSLASQWKIGKTKQDAPEEIDPDAPMPFEGIDIAELEQFSSEQPDWIVQGVFSADQPTLFGARSKCLKTTQLIDLSVALASGTPWLTSFEIPKKRRVLFITGESNYRATARRLQKAAKVRNLKFQDLAGMLRVEAIHFPKLPDHQHQMAVAAVVEKHSPDVVIIDPLYRGLTADIDPHKMSQVGEAIVAFAKACEPASLILSHHVNKAAARELGHPPELEDMNGAGIAETCGNWWLVGRNEKYEWDWKHDLCVQFGGRDEQGGARRIVFDESTWTADVESFKDFIGGREEAAQRAKQEQKAAAHHAKTEQARLSILHAMRNKKKPRSQRQWEDLRGMNPQGVWRGAFSDMVTEGTIVICPYKDAQNRVQSQGYILAELAAEYEQSPEAQEMFVDVR